MGTRLGKENADVLLKVFEFGGFGIKSVSNAGEWETTFLIETAQAGGQHEDESTLMEQVWEQTKREIEEEEAQQERDDRSTKQYSRGVFGFR